jgi:PAS domain S-box-containing protein
LKDTRRWEQFDVVAALVVVLDREGRLVAFNRAAERFTGWSSAEVLGRAVWDVFIVPEEIEAVRAVFGQLRAGQFPNEHENYWLTRSGERRWIAWSNTALCDPAGEVEFVIATGVDISRRKSAEDDLGRARQKERLLDEANDVLAHALSDYDETLHAVARLAVQSFADLCTIARVDDESRAARRVAVTCSDPSKEASAEAFRSFPVDGTHSTIMARVLETRRAELHTQSSYIEEPTLDPAYVRLVRELDPRSIIVAPLVSRGRALGLMSLARTRAAAFDANDLRLAQELGQRAGLHIDNARLYRRALQAIHARDDVMSIVAHDLRNPLNSIGIQAQLIVRGVEAQPVPVERLRDAATSIRTSVASMDRLIRDLFDAARGEAGQLVQSVRPCEPARLVGDAGESVRALAASKGLALRLVVAPELPLVSADRERVHQVLSNLLGNAIKFTPAGGTLTVTAEREERCVAFVVSDTGPGIAAEDLPRVFDRFWRGKSSDHKGVGLGLWICKGIVQSHGGEITAQSTPGHGCKFRFTLPLAPVHPVP